MILTKVTMSWRRFGGLLPSLRFGSKRTLSTEKEEPKFPHDKLDNMDFMTAAKILFTTPPKPKKFGIDFHLVQLFFACLPSVAVYLVAQYARYDIRKREAELEMKKQDKEKEDHETKHEGLDSDSPEAGKDPAILQVEKRLDDLERAVKQIVEQTRESFSGKDEGLRHSKLANATSECKDGSSTPAMSNIKPKAADASPKCTDQAVAADKPPSGVLNNEMKLLSSTLRSKVQ